MVDLGRDSHLGRKTTSGSIRPEKEGRADPGGKSLGLGCDLSPAWLETAFLSAGVPGLCLQSML